ncbi:GlxA family transcriptional regulator [Shumkonia mesophila]|uniref:GlxA family transcriptional regulator n=1 Tax=Shumkonia mesophila TaxID=2838854 RepID=UPI002934855E|nr:helix-turn-helix domain-containing protein [Shumkonia mesophila]
MSADRGTLHVSLVAIPEAAISTLSGIYDVLNALRLLSGFSDAIPERSPIAVEIVGLRRGNVDLASGLPMPVQRAIAEIEETDIVIVPSLLVPGGNWQAGRYDGLVDWLKAMYARGATLCSACSGLYVLAETGLFDGRDSTIHWSYAAGFGKSFPAVRLHPERVLIAAGDDGRLITSGASTSWHDLVLYLIARHAGLAAAQAITKFFALQWHQEGLAPYVVFSAPTDHGDAAVARVQAWLATNYSVARPVEEMVRRSGLTERSFKRRFTKATGHSPIAYVQRLRVEEGKRRLERTTAPIEEIAWQVGYEDPAFFRRLFRRLAGISPGAHRRTFQMPASVGPAPAGRA